ncbi:Prenylated Rab acceptor 1 [Penicillium diatomitis]|uniref:PRA1 family protein n=1 Tax=Penicillium diatomitis TaxID=2819901 RepID=A0A9W9WV09_9EURO|nr:Prenylated Rab acceptor 1 [Penicillium diatomitis]KAJ5477223.1 Prenylated Rab acceptor 1 [Penicillium diatomitis]
MAIQIPIEVITSRFGDRFNSLRSQSMGSRFANLRPISEFFDLKRLSKPANIGEVQSRVNYNLGYFSSNYAVVFVMLSIYSLLTNWPLMFLIMLVAVGLWGIGRLNGRDLDLGFRRFNTSQLYTIMVCIAVPLFFWASPIGTFMWLIGATGVTVFGHAAMMDKPIENAFSEEAV